MTKQYNDPFYHVDYNAIIGGLKGDGVKSGLDVSERGAGQNMSIDVSSGEAWINNIKYTESSTVNLSISAAHGTLPRRDIVIYDTATTNPSVITGTASSEPIPPNITSGDILLAVVNIAAGVTAITNSNIDDGKIDINEHGTSHESGGYDEFIPNGFTSPSDVTSSRSLGSIYHNTSGSPRAAYITCKIDSGFTSGDIRTDISTSSSMSGSIRITNDSYSSGALAPKTVLMIVPNNYYYRVTTYLHFHLDKWIEIDG